ncbi:MAG: hypothetical protein JXQ87_03460 [Bacteroidia bacterium]
MLKKIWTYWNSGEYSAPDLVKICFKSWKIKNPDFLFTVLNDESAEEYLKKIPLSADKIHTLSIQHKSDLLRTVILKEYGGVWVDATLYCNEPLSRWMTKSLSEGIFFFKDPGPDRVISNWFISVSEPNNYLINEILKALCQYWDGNEFRRVGNNVRWYYYMCRLLSLNKKLTEFWFSYVVLRILKLKTYRVYHYLVWYLMVKDRKFKMVMEKMPILPAKDAHLLKRLNYNEFGEENPTEFMKLSPVFKLDWRINISELHKESTLNKVLELK